MLKNGDGVAGTIPLPAERRVLARRGWAGEISGFFEHPARSVIGEGYECEEKHGEIESQTSPWNHDG